ncbi:SMI1/KNR4 family protein [Streptomyces sp. NPDC001027]|uniref:SMI1/KNR4 family protein n=1 Tax=Streptomyces sp. NPDC001027 TaxID=3154771 RepID=UPI0033188255
MRGTRSPLRTRWLGLPPASEERIRSSEERLGHRLPPSYRAFVAVSDGYVLLDPGDVNETGEWAVHCWAS